MVADDGLHTIFIGRIEPLEAECFISSYKFQRMLDNFLNITYQERKSSIMMMRILLNTVKVFATFLFLIGTYVYGEVKNENGKILFQEKFDNPESAVKNLGYDPRSNGWEISDGILKTKSDTEGVVSLAIGDSNWRNYQVEFKVKRIKIQAGDQHFGIKGRYSYKNGQENYLQLYCRYSDLWGLEAGSNKSQGNLGFLPKRMKIGPEAEWSCFKIVFDGDEVTASMDNIPFAGKITNIAALKGGAIFYAYNTNIWLDDIKVTSIKSNEKRNVIPQKQCKNKVVNGGFEYSTQDNLPDYWGCPHWGMIDPYWNVHFDEWTKNYGIDRSTAYEGKASMKITNPFDQSANVNSGLCLRSCQLGLTPNAKNTLSAYMKSQPAGVKVNFAGQKVIVLTDDWCRYEVPFVREGGAYDDMINIYPGSKGTFWIDAVQMEQGDKATSYEPAPIKEQEQNASYAGRVENTNETRMTPEKFGISDKKILMRTRYDVITSEHDLTAKCFINYAKETLKERRLQLEIKNKDKVVLTKRFDVCIPDMLVNMDISELPLGEYTMAASLLNEQMKVVEDSSQVFRKMARQPDEVKIDKIGRFITVNGKPFIPFGFYWEGGITKEIITSLAQEGFNTVCVNNEPWDLLDHAASEGMRMLFSPDSVKWLKPEQKETFATLMKNISSYKSHPGLLGFPYTDEPFGQGWGASGYETLKSAYQDMKKTAPLKLIYINDNPPAVFWLQDEGVNFPTDLMSIDTYPSPLKLYEVADTSRYLDAACRNAGIPSLMVIFNGGYSFGSPREYTPAEEEFCTYTSIINGARGILYWANHSRSKSLWNKIKAMGREIKAMTPVLTSQEPTIKVGVSPSIQVLTKCYDGSLYVITLNETRNPLKAKITFPGGKAKIAEVLFENRTIHITNSVLEDNFEGYQRHVYKVDLK
jgi:hypothetical protein